MNEFQSRSENLPSDNHDGEADTAFYDHENRNVGVELEFSLGLDSEHNKFPVIIIETEYRNLNEEVVPFRAEINEASFKTIQKTLRNAELATTPFADVSKLYGRDRYESEQALKTRELAIIEAKLMAATYAENLLSFALRGVDDPTLKGRFTDQILEKAAQANELEKALDRQTDQQFSA